MSSDGATEQAPDEAAGEEDKPSRIAGAVVLLVLAGVAVLVLKVIVTAAPYTAYLVAGILLDRAWLKARGWIARRKEDREDELPAEDVDVVGALQSLASGGRHVLLTELKTKLGVADTKAVRALLDGSLVPVRPGVRTPAGNGPGVHYDDVPPVVDDPSEGRCLCRSDANANGNNEGGEGAREGLRVEPIGLSGHVVRDPADDVRHHEVRSRWGHSGNGAS